MISGYGQEFELTNQINGSYHLFEAERGVNNKSTKTKLIEYGENNGIKLLAVAACEKCIPAVYTYKKEESIQMERPVFFNSSGLWVVKYDDESFVIFMPDPAAGSDSEKLYISNFYSKSKFKVENMTKAKIKDFVLNL